MGKGGRIFQFDKLTVGPDIMIERRKTCFAWASGSGDKHDRPGRQPDWLPVLGQEFCRRCPGAFRLQSPPGSKRSWGIRITPMRLLIWSFRYLMPNPLKCTVSRNTSTPSLIRLRLSLKSMPNRKYAWLRKVGKSGWFLPYAARLMLFIRSEVIWAVIVGKNRISLVGECTIKLSESRFEGIRWTHSFWNNLVAPWCLLKLLQKYLSAYPTFQL